MNITKELLAAKGACKAGLEWFTAQFGEHGDYQDILNRLAQDRNPAWAHWLMDAIGPIDSTIELSGEISGHLFVAGNLKISTSLRVALSFLAGGRIEAGGEIKAGWGIEAGGGIEAGEDWGIYCGLRLRLSLRAEAAVVVCPTPPARLVCGTHKLPDDLGKKVLA